MPIKPWDVIRVPFPYVERPVRYHRPALVIAALAPSDTISIAWVIMITSADNAGWHGDVTIGDVAGAGLRHPSIIRTAKLATIDLKHADAIGRIAGAERAAVEGWIRQYLGQENLSEA